jgi:hypothetical protein
VPARSARPAQTAARGRYLVYAVAALGLIVVVLLILVIAT